MKKSFYTKIGITKCEMYMPLVTFVYDIGYKIVKVVRYSTQE